MGLGGARTVRRRSLLLLAAGLIAAGCGAGRGTEREGEGGGMARSTADEALLGAARDGDAEAVADALAGGARIEARDGEERTALLLAADGDRVEAARTLVGAGADVNAVDRRSDTPFLVTGVTGSTAMLDVLLEADPGPDTALTNRFGGTAVIPACERGHAGYVREVLRRTDVDVDHVNDLGWTGLLEAVILGDGGPDHQEVVRVLLDAGADPGLADRDGVTPLGHAESSGADEIARILRDAGAK
ncbi:ankyrin repeat domain-containing protein [Nocardiopsis sp. CNT-189]